MDIQTTRTTISGRLGEWIELGGVLRESASRTSGPLVVEEQRASEGSVQVRVDEVP